VKEMSSVMILICTWSKDKNKLVPACKELSTIERKYIFLRGPVFKKIQHNIGFKW
jgi:hypothetical protein